MLQEMEDRLIELEAMQKVLLEGVGQLNPAATFTRQEKKILQQHYLLDQV